jgi:hypothetical protein
MNNQTKYGSKIFIKRVRVSKSASKVLKKKKGKNKTKNSRNQKVNPNEKLLVNHHVNGRFKINPLYERKLTFSEQKKYKQNKIKKIDNLRYENDLSTKNVKDMRIFAVESNNRHKINKKSPYSERLPRTKEVLMFLQLQKNLKKKN